MTAALSRLFVLFVSIALLIFIGFSEAGRVYPALQLKSICSQSELYTDRINNMLALGFDINHRRFADWAEQLQKQNPYFKKGFILPTATTTSPQTLFCDQTTSWNFALDSWKYLLQARAHNTYYYVASSLTSQKKSDNGLAQHHAGQLVLQVDQEAFYQEILTAIRLNLLIMIALLVLATVTMIWLHSHCPRRLGCCSKIIFHVSYAIAASAVLISLLGLFEKGISNKTGAMTKSLLERLDVPAQMQLDLKQHLTLIDQNLLKHYTQDDADIQSIELYQHGKRLYYAAAPGITESDLSTLQVGVSPCTSKHFGFGSCTAITSDPSLILKVIVPTKRVYNRLFRAAKNLLMLFISTTLIANLFLNIANVFSTSTAQQLKSQQHKREFPERAESLLRPVFTLGVFIEGLNLAFLPNYLKHFTSGGPVSIFFTSYFLCFALALVPAGRYAARRHLPHMMIVAFILNFIGLYLLVFAQNIYWAIAARALSACGQGILLIAVQAHLLRLETGSTRSGGARLIVLGFNIGVISGTSIGALLASLFGEAPVFLIGMAVCVFCILYISRTITNIEPTTQAPAPMPTPSSTPRHPKHQLSISQLSIKTTLIASYLKNFLNPELLKLTLLIGIPAKAAFTGVLVFALPLVLSGFNLTKDEVGQILIFYSFGIVVTTTLINKISNTGISPAALLFMGCIGSGFGLIIISYTSSLSLAPTQLKIMITVGILLLGLFHGFIHAPAVTYIARLTHIKTEDRPALIANYRLLERVGHIMGPTLATLFLIQNGRFLESHMLLFGLTIMIGGLLFLITHSDHP